MTKTKSTKRALLMSALALIMCVAMLVGSTYAWFTDSVTSAGNIIKSGTLDVTMEWLEGNVAPTDDAAWIDASEGAIFNYDLWEPGYTEVRHIKIVNEGTLALKYQVFIVANGEVSELSDVIDVYYIDPAEEAITNRAQLKEENKLGTLTDVLATVRSTASGKLLAGEKHTVTLALKMQEEAGNNYQGLAIGTDFSVQLLATQYTYEEDSFDDQYDADAQIPTYVTTEEELRAVAEVGGLAIFGNDISVRGTVNMNGGIIDGDGKTVTATAAVGTGSATINPTGGTLKNLVLEGTGNTRSAYGIGSIQFSNTTLTEDMLIENVDVSKTRMAIDLDANGNSVYVKDCELANMIQVANQQEAVFENCHFYCDGTTPAMLGNGTNNIVVLGNMTFINCHFEENINFYFDGSYSGTLKFINCTYGNNGVEDRPFEPTVGFFTWWMEPQGIANYPGSFGDGDRGRTDFTCIVDDTVVWEATNN